MRELSLHILDVVENSLEAGATCVEIEIVEDTARNRMTISVTDNGRGMDEQMLQRVSDPYFTTRTTRHVGLGIPLFKAAAQRCSGDLAITSTPGMGTRVVAHLERDHIDRAPLGDMKSTLWGVILSHQACRIRYVHRVDERVFELDTQEIREVLGEVPLSHPAVRAWIEDYLNQEEVYLAPRTD